VSALTLITAVHLLGSSLREAVEQECYQALLEYIPNLAMRLFDANDEELRKISDAVCAKYRSPILLLIRHLASKRRQLCSL
jgi:hypothetical protein